MLIVALAIELLEQLAYAANRVSLDAISELPIRVPGGSLAPLLDRPQPIGFVLVGIISGRRRDQLRAFLAEMIEITAHRLALHRVHVEGVVRYRRREILKHGPKPDGRSEVTARAGLRRARHHSDRVAHHQTGFTDGLAVALP